jgi:hypothetical protein
MDSAMKAAFHWAYDDSQGGGGGDYFASLTVPIALLSRPFWDVCIDGGAIDDPVIRTRAYQTNSYPLPQRGARTAMTLVWSEPELPQMVKALDDLYHWFRDEVTKLDAKWHPTTTFIE